MKYSEFRSKISNNFGDDFNNLHWVLTTYLDHYYLIALNDKIDYNPNRWRDKVRGWYESMYMQEFPDIYEKFLDFDDLEDREIEDERPRRSETRSCNGHEWVPLFNENHLVCKHCGIDKVEV